MERSPQKIACDISGYHAVFPAIPKARDAERGKSSCFDS
jgi:hypothetical protein